MPSGPLLSLLGGSGYPQECPDAVPGPDENVIHQLDTISPTPEDVRNDGVVAA